MSCNADIGRDLGAVEEGGGVEVYTDDERFMAQALSLAMRGRGWVNPNPLVGCVIVACEEVIGQGWHSRYGAPHAEREALADCASRGNTAEGASVYVTLEPCSHYGKTPPCVDALIEAKVARVVIGSFDPNPQVAGRGVDALKRAGIEVVQGCLKEKCDEINKPFFHWITTKTPFVIAKFAMTLDGKTATKTGASKWITGSSARERVHEDRATYSSIMVGVGTVLADDPMLTARPCDWKDPHQPIRIVCDTALSTPPDCNIVQSAFDYKTYIATSVENEEAYRPFKEAGCGVIYVPKDSSGHVDLTLLFEILGDMGIDSVIVEGGATLTGSAFDANIVDRVQAYIAPKIFGGRDAASAVAGSGVALPDEAYTLKDVRVLRLGEDILIEGDCVRDRLGE